MIKELLKNIFSIGRLNDYTKFVKIFGIRIKFKNSKYPVLGLLDPGGIGDYIFCRPYFKYIKQSTKFKNYKIIFITKDKYEDFVKVYDSEYFDEIISYDAIKFENNKKYKKRLIKNINNHCIETLANLRCLTVIYEKDWDVRYEIAKGINAKQKMVGMINFHSETELRKEKQFKIYDKFISKGLEDKIFETERRRRFFEDFLDMNLPEEEVDLPILVDKKKKNIAISVMAAHEKRLYAPEKWVEIINYIIDATDNDTQILMLGAVNEKEYIENIISNVKLNKKITNLSGKVPVTFLPQIIKDCELLISVETGTVHMARSVGCPCIVLCNGSYYGRFQPYSDNSIRYIYPREFNELIKDKNILKLMEFYNLNTKYKTSDIEVDDIKTAINDYMKGMLNV